ncbi:FMRFamide receptor-like [Tigriopus californicus]|uniref:FMRFamide receptor-like n=1 Tax=Tigriopus californicus TaxID=6832 RepID=UPI0027DAA304|nr:FMRFamide receptor-like [Tigriopus californicus]
MMSVPQDWIQFLTDGVALGVVCVFGVLANSLATVVLVLDKGVELSQIFTRILIALMTYDSVLLLGLFSIYSWPMLNVNFQREIYPWIVPYVLPVVQISLTGSVYMTMAISVERYFSLRSILDFKPNENQGRPQGFQEACSPMSCQASIFKEDTWISCLCSFLERCSVQFEPRRSISYILPIGVFSLIYNITRFFELRTVKKYFLRNATIPARSTAEEAEGTLSFPVESETVLFSNETVLWKQFNYSYYNVEMTEMRANDSYICNYILLSNCIFMAAIPLVLLISMNSLLYKLLQSQKLLNKAQLNRRVKRDQTVAGMFIAIVMVFIVCHTPKIVCSIYELCKVWFDNHHNWSDWTQHLISLNHLMLAVNSSINFLIYSWKDSKFRTAMLKKVCFFRKDRTCPRFGPCGTPEPNSDPYDYQSPHETRSIGNMGSQLIGPEEINLTDVMPIPESSPNLRKTTSYSEQTFILMDPVNENHTDDTKKPVRLSMLSFVKNVSDTVV